MGRTRSTLSTWRTLGWTRQNLWFAVFDFNDEARRGSGGCWSSRRRTRSGAPGPTRMSKSTIPRVEAGSIPVPSEVEAAAKRRRTRTTATAPGAGGCRASANTSQAEVGYHGRAAGARVRTSKRHRGVSTGGGRVGNDRFESQAEASFSPSRASAYRARTTGQRAPRKRRGGRHRERRRG